jgi:hypothetical protein
VAERFAIQDLQSALRERQYPSVTVWNRLEGRPRTLAFDRSLKAEVRDPLWMLARQWQVGELAGDDAGSPLTTRYSIGTTPLTEFRPDSHPAEPFDATTPLEATVERRPIPLEQNNRKIALEHRLVLGRHWLRMIADFQGYRQGYVDRYGVDLPDGDDPADADRCAHPEAWQAFAAAAAGRAMDGADFYEHLTGNPAGNAWDGIDGVDPNDRQTLAHRAQKFVEWAERTFFQPYSPDETAWIPERLEYQLACAGPSASGEKRFVAEEYYRGRLDWHDFEVAAVEREDDGTGHGPPAPPPPVTRTVLAAPVKFDGMPDPRWWAFEDARTNLGLVDAATTDLAKLLFVEFGLVYANDWFVIPSTADAGCAATVRGIAVTNVFGERFWIEPAGAGAESGWQRWTMYSLSVEGQPEGTVEATLLLLPSAVKTQDGEPTEDVLLIRDEVANMAWGVERRVPLPSGESKQGSEAGYETRRFFERLAGPAPATAPGAEGAKVRYRVMEGVAENLIPFVPVHVPGSNREIQLQRAAMTRTIAGGPQPPAKIRPRTSLLRVGLDNQPATGYFIHEEEVPRAGVRVFESYRRTRSRDGRVFLWLGVRKQVGRGEGSSRLAFDQIVDLPPA